MLILNLYADALEDNVNTYKKMTNIEILNSFKKINKMIDDSDNLRLELERYVYLYNIVIYEKPPTLMWRISIDVKGLQNYLLAFNEKKFKKNSKEYIRNVKIMENVPLIIKQLEASNIKSYCNRVDYKYLYSRGFSMSFRYIDFDKNLLSLLTIDENYCKNIR